MMKRRAFIQTILGALAAIGIGTKLLDRQSVDQGLVCKIIGNDGPHGCDGVYHERIYLRPYKGEKKGQMLFLSQTHGISEWVDLEYLKLIYQKGLLKNIGPFTGETITAWSGKNWLKIPLDWLT